MERLTYNDDGCWQVHGADEMLCKQVCEEYSNCDSCPIGRAIDRLAEYEDTGLTVERAKELGKADQEGRVVVLPCKVGDKIYLRGKADKRTRSGARIVEQAISYIAIYDDWIDIDGICEAEELGEYAFLTREEAEKVLEAENHERPDNQ